MTVCAACCTPKAPPPHRRSVSFSDVDTIETIEPSTDEWPDAERRGMRVKIARDDVDWAKVVQQKRPEDIDGPHVLGVALDYDGRAYEVRVLDAYTAWLPRYRFSVVSDS